MDELEDECNSSVDLLDDEENKKVDFLMDWIQAEGIFKGDLRRHFVANYLCGCKFDVEKTQLKIVRYARARTSCSHFFRNRDVAEERIMDLINTGFLCFLKQRDHRDRFVVIADMSRFDASKYNAIDFVKLVGIVQDSCLLKKFRRSNEWVWILDIKRVPFALLRQFTPKLIYQMTDTCLINMPMRIKEIHIFNANAFSMTLVKIVFMFLSTKMKERISFHGQASLLYDKLPLDCLPIEYGGFGGTLQENIDNFREYLLNVRDELLELTETYDFD